MEVLQLETLTGLGFCVSLYLLELMHFRLGSICLEYKDISASCMCPFET